MQIITNTRLVESRGTWGKRLTWVGLFLLFGAVLMPFREELLAWSWPVMMAGFLVTNVGMYYYNRYARPPLPHEMLESALKGLDNRYRLFNFMGPVDHVLLTPVGVLVITLRRMGGDIRCRENKWAMKTSLLSKLRLFTEEQLGNPGDDLLRDVKGLQKLLELKLPADENEKPVPIGGFVYFGNPEARLTLDQPTVPVLHIKTIKDYLRRQASGERLSPARMEAVAAILEGR
jgi:hypothetical protein